jgi:hypothetical protein
LQIWTLITLDALAGPQFVYGDHVAFVLFGSLHCDQSILANVFCLQAATQFDSSNILAHENAGNCARRGGIFFVLFCFGVLLQLQPQQVYDDDDAQNMTGHKIRKRLMVVQLDNALDSIIELDRVLDLNQRLWVVYSWVSSSNDSINTRPRCSGHHRLFQPQRVNVNWRQSAHFFYLPRYFLITLKPHVKVNAN